MAQTAINRNLITKERVRFPNSPCVGFLKHKVALYFFFLQVIQYSLISIILLAQYIMSFIHLFNYSFNFLFYLVIPLLPTLYDFSN
jgi:hypothetical protein